MTVNILDQDIVVTILDDDTVVVNLLNPNQQQQSALEFQDEGVTLGTAGTVTKVNFIGSSVVATRSGSTVNVTISGGGSGTPGGTSGQIQYNNSGSFGGFGSWNGTTFALGTLGYSDTGIVASFQSSTNSYNQVVLQNTSNGTTASTNFNVSNNSGTATTNFGEFGINSSGFTGTGSFSQAGYVYLAAATTDLVLGTYGNMPIHFTVNSGATDAMLINASGNISIGAQTDTARLLVQKNSLGTSFTNADGIYLLNSTAAAAGAQQISPPLVWGGDGWKTNATAGRQTVAYSAYVLPVQGTANPTGLWNLGYSVNGAAYTTGMSMTTAGKTTFTGTTEALNIDLTNGANNVWLRFTSSAGASDYGRYELQANELRLVGGTAGFKYGMTSVSIATTQTVNPTSFIPAVQHTFGNHTGMTLNTAFPMFQINTGTLTWADGTVPLQSLYWIKTPTYNGTTTLATFTDAVTLQVDAPTAGAKAAFTNGATAIYCNGILKVGGSIKFSGTNSTGAGSAALGANSPASTLTAPYTWLTAISSDGSTVYIPVWK